jgi:hypothetical protein
MKLIAQFMLLAGLFAGVCNQCQTLVSQSQ